MKDTTIHIALVSSDEYIKYATTVILSILKNNKTNRYFHFHIITNDIQNKSKSKLQKLQKYNFAISYHAIPAEMTQQISTIKQANHVNSNIFSRLFLPDLFPKLDKILCLDCDLFVRSDISPLYDLDIKNYCLAAVEDTAETIIAQRLWNDKSHHYYNTGVMLQNLQQMRKENYKQIIYNKIHKNSDKYTIGEQDIFNDVYKDKICHLNYTWNFFHEYHFTRKYFTPIDINEYQQALNNPNIVHFVGPEKPWLPSENHPYQKEFFKYFKATPFYNPWKLFYKYNYIVRNKSYKSLYLKSFCLFLQKNTPDETIIYKFGLKNKINKHYNRLSLFGFTIKKKEINSQITKIQYLGNIFKISKQKNSRTTYFLGLPIISKLDTPQKRYIKFLGLPIYYKKKNKISQLQEDIQKLTTMFQQEHNYNQIINRKLSNLKCIIEAQTLHKETFSKYKNLFSNKDVVLVCSGPSANQYRMLPNAIHVGVNGAIYLKHIKLDYLFIQDYTIHQKNNNTLNRDALSYQGNNCIKFFGIIPDDRLACVKHIVERIPVSFSCYPNTFQYLLEDWPRHNIAHDLSREPLGDFESTTFSALQFILYTHPKRIFLVGWDCNAGYAYNRPNEGLPANNQINLMTKYFVPFIKTYYPDIEIISVNPVGLKGIFNDINQNKDFNHG